MQSLWMIVASLLFACMGVCVKLGSAYFSTGELVFYRGFVGLLLMALLARWQGISYRTPHWRRQLSRGLSGTGSLMCYFFALGALPLATAVTLNYTSPLFVALLLALWPFPENAQQRSLSDRFVQWKSLPLLAVCLLTWIVNLESLSKGQGSFLSPSLRAWAPVLTSYQSWGVFAGPGLERDGWFAIEVLGRDGKSYDAWRNDQLFGADRPEVVSQTYPNDRWRKWMLSLPALAQDDPYRARFAQWCLEQWNRRHPDNPAVRVRVWNAVVLTSPGRSSGPANWELIAEAKP